MLDAGCPAVPDELLRHPVRIPWSFSDGLVGEDKRAAQITDRDRGDQIPLFPEQVLRVGV